MSGHRAHGPSREQQRRVLWIALGANGAFFAAELIGGIVFNSLALLADAAHMLSDVFALAVALAAQALVARPASARHTYGLQRAEVLGAQINGLTLLAAAAWIFYEAIGRVGDPVDVQGAGVLAVATMGLIVNLTSAAMLHRVQGGSLNMRGAFLHMALDGLGSIGAISAGIAVLVWGADWFDPVVSMLIGLLVLWSAWHLLREATHVLLEGAPRGIEVAEVERALGQDRGVEAVHHIHLWNLASDVPAISAHLVLKGNGSLHDAQLEGDRIKTMLHDRFGIEHATLELECHVCEAEEKRGRGPSSRS